MKRAGDGADRKKKKKKSRNEYEIDEDDSEIEYADPPVKVTPDNEFVVRCYRVAEDVDYVTDHELAIFEAELLLALKDQFTEMKKRYGAQLRSRAPKGDMDVESVEDEAIQLLMSVRAKKQAEEEKKLDALTLASRRAPDDGALSQGRLSFISIHMGWGDCTLLKTPLGRLILIDCGSGGNSNQIGARKGAVNAVNEAIKTLSSAFGKSTELDILILTHADKDHHNKLGQVLRKLAITKIGMVYHSDDIGSYQHAKSLKDQKLLASKAIAALARSTRIRRVILTRKECSIRKVDPPEAYTPPLRSKKGTALEYRDDTDGSLIIHEEKDCVVRILASEVDFDPAFEISTSRPGIVESKRNESSVVTLIEGCGKKILVTGDAKIVTEAEMLKKYKASKRLEDIDVLRVSHHGSDLDCTGSKFIERAEPKMALFSSGYKVSGHHFPAIEVYERCWTTVDGKSKAHNLWYYAPLANAHQHDNLAQDSVGRYAGRDKVRESYQKKELWTTGSGGTISLSFKPAKK